MNVIQEIEQEQLARLTDGKDIPDFGPGDTVRVNVRVVEGTRERVQAFEGVCISRKNDGIHTSFTVRKISYGEGVERVFPLYSPSIETIDLIRRGRVRRAKLYYLRGRTGKAARIAERTTGRARRKDVDLAIGATDDSPPATAAEAFEAEETLTEAQQAAANAAKEGAAKEDSAKNASAKEKKAEAKPADPPAGEAASGEEDSSSDKKSE